MAYIDANKLKEALLLDQTGAKDTLRTSSYLHPVRKLEIMAHIDAISYCIEEINKIPTTDVAEVKHGEWCLHPDGSGTCNQCGRTQKAVWDFDNAQEYCGHCGAKMDGGKI